MSSIWVVAGYEKEPVGQVRADLVKRANGIVREMFPQGQIDIDTQAGSWWLIVTVVCETGGRWLLDVLGKWGVTKCLDRFVAALRENNALPSQEAADAAGISDPAQREAAQSIVSLDDKLNQCVALARELNHGAPLRVLNIAEWNPERGEGSLLQLKTDGETETMSFVKCRNIEDLQRLMRS
jgi:hypothetical protein